MTKYDLSFSERFRQQVWGYVIYPIFPFIEQNLNFLHKRHRQPCHIGWIAPGKSLADLKAHLSDKWEFGNHFVAWTDADQVLSWRKLASFREQYHIRVFKDGEIRGHFEPTPEAAPIRHFRDSGETSRTDDFMMFLGDIVTTTEHISQIEFEKNYEQIAFTPSKYTRTKIYKVPRISFPYLYLKILWRLGLRGNK